MVSLLENYLYLIRWFNSLLRSGVSLLLAHDYLFSSFDTTKKYKNTVWLCAEQLNDRIYFMCFMPFCAEIKPVAQVPKPLAHSYKPLCDVTIESRPIQYKIKKPWIYKNKL